MRIQIKNYKGISDLTYEVEENKINFLFGMSGSGKSSLASALIDNNPEENVTFGKDKESFKIEITPDLGGQEAFKIYNLDYLKGILIEKSDGNDIYSIILGERDVIDKCRDEYNTSISSIIKVKEEILNLLTNINSLEKDLKIKVVNDNQISKSALTNKFSENIRSIRSYRFASRFSAKEIKWFDDGSKMDSYLNGKCPFCNRKTTSRIIERINILLNFDSKTYEKINNSNAFVNLGITLPKWESKNDVKKFNRKVVEMLTLKPLLEKYNTYIDLASKTEFTDPKILLEKPPALLKKYSLSIYEAIVDFNSHVIAAKVSLGKLVKETKKLLKDHCAAINEKLELLGIPYRFLLKEVYEEENTANYFICHINNQSGVDNTDSLSFGEKNIIGLILFLLANKNHEGIVIDDPASSFDDYRRKAIFDLIYDLHENSTVLVLSHDFVFAKYAVFHKSDAEKLFKKGTSLSLLKSKFLNETGKIDFIESYGEKNIIKHVSYENFGILENFVKNRLLILGNDINYQTALNIRLLFELKKNNKKAVYGYLSAIIHRYSYEEIITLLNKAGTNESSILNEIQKITEITYNGLSPDYLDHVNDFNYLDFEKIVKCRECLNARVKKDKVVKDELSNIIHMNSAYFICLNPYDFNYFSKYVKDYIDKH